MVVVVVYAPDAQYDASIEEERGDYSQRLGQRAATIVKGTTAARWKPGKPMPKPTTQQLKHPKRLLFSDLKLQLWHYACKPLHECGFPTEAEGPTPVGLPFTARSMMVGQFRVFRVRELAGRSGSASKTPPLNPPRFWC